MAAQTELTTISDKTEKSGLDSARAWLDRHGGQNERRYRSFLSVCEITPTELSGFYRFYQLFRK